MKKKDSPALSFFYFGRIACRAVFSLASVGRLIVNQTVCAPIKKGQLALPFFLHTG